MDVGSFGEIAAAPEQPDMVHETMDATNENDPKKIVGYRTRCLQESMLRDPKLTKCVSSMWTIKYGD